MALLSVDILNEWTESNFGGLLVGFSQENQAVVNYYVHEFGVPTVNPNNQIGAIRCGEYLVVGKKWFREQVWLSFNYSE